MLEPALKSSFVLDEPTPTVRIWEADVRPIKHMVFVYSRNYLESFAAKDEVLRNAWEPFVRAGFNFSAPPPAFRNPSGEKDTVEELEAATLPGEVPLPQPLSENERSELARGGIYRTFSPRDTIIEDGEAGESTFVILSGLVDVRRRMEGNRVLDLARLGSYEYFGEMFAAHG